MFFEVRRLRRFAQPHRRLSGFLHRFGKAGCAVSSASRFVACSRMVVDRSRAEARRNRFSADAELVDPLDVRPFEGDAAARSIEVVTDCAVDYDGRRRSGDRRRG
jgi:hypothetical protein